MTKSTQERLEVSPGHLTPEHEGSDGTKETGLPEGRKNLRAPWDMGRSPHSSPEGGLRAKGLAGAKAPS